MIVPFELPKRLDADAITIWPFILVRPRRAQDEPLIAHELVHHGEQGVAQMAAALLLTLLTGSAWWLLAIIVPLPVWYVAYAIPWFRLRAEVRGYRKQIELGGISVTDAAFRITTKYGLNVSHMQVVDLLTA